MKKLLGDAQLEEARSCASPIKNMTSCNRSLDFGVKKYVIFLYADTQYLTRPFTSITQVSSSESTIAETHAARCSVMGDSEQPSIIF